MTVDELLQAIEQRGATVRVEGDRLAVYPKAVLTDELREAIRRHRDELVARLKPAPPRRNPIPDEAREEAASYLVIDPRPDLREDSHLWQLVLTAAKASPEVQGLLHGLRCGGCRLEGRHNGSLRLDYTALLDVWDEDELRREWLEPARREIQNVFREVARMQAKAG